MNILYCTDENYAWLAGISIVSLMENNKQYDVDVYIIADNISEKSKDELLSLHEMYENLTIHIEEQPDWDELLGLKLDSGQYWSLSTYSRLFVENIFNGIDKLIYLDCDIMVNNDLMSMWSFDIDDYWIGGIQDCISSLKWAAGLKTSDAYINAGVLLMNLRKMKEDNVKSQCIRYIKERNGQIFFNDQTVINDLMHEHIYILPAKYNVVTPTIINGYKSMELVNDYTSYYSENEIDEAVKNPTLIHFVGGSYVGRPWIEGCLHPFTEQFLQYKAISPWKDKPLLKDMRPFRKKLFEYIKGAKNKYWVLVMLVQILKGKYARA